MAISGSGSVRPSVIAGSWYPGSKQSLIRAVDGYLSRVEQPRVSGELLALISPHAGYAYSGQTAAYAYHQLRDRDLQTVVLLGPSHRDPIGDCAVSEEEAYETPMGRVQLDESFVADLAQRFALRRIRHDAEHSLEIQLPFLQRQLGDFRLVPVMMGTGDPKVARRLAAALVETYRQPPRDKGRILLVASSDLHHIADYDQVVRRDQKVVDAIAAYDLDTLSTLLTAPYCSVCGRMPILTVLHAAQMLGANAVQILHHTNSGDVTGQRWPGQYTVGYLAAAVYRTQ